MDGRPLRLWCLPRSVGVMVLRDWIVDVKDITALDVAVAKALRAWHFSVLGDSGFVLKYDDVHSIMLAQSHADWLNQRHIRLGSLVVDASQMNALCSIHAELLLSLHRVEFHGLGNTLGIAQLRSFLSRCGQLREVDFSRCQMVPPEALDVLMGLSHLRPVRLDLSSFHHLPTHAIIALVTHFADVIEHLRLCGNHCVLPVFRAIQAQCWNIQKLAIHTTGIDRCILVDFLSNSAALQRLSLFDAEADNELAMELVRRLPNLVRLKFKDASKVTSSSLPMLLGASPKLEAVEVHAVYSYRVRHYHRCQRVNIGGTGTAIAGTSGRSCELNFTRSVTDPAVIVESIRACTAPVSALYCAGPVRQHTLRKIAELAGETLHSLKICLHHDVDDDTLAFVADACANLRVLELSKCGSVTDESLATIAAFCPRLHSVGLKNAHQISDAGVIILLGVMGSNLMSLHLTGCSDVSDQCLEAFSEFGECLREVSLYDTQITPDGLVALIQSDRLQNLRHLTVSEHVRAATVERLAHFNPSVQRRWHKVLTSFIF